MVEQTLIGMPATSKATELLLQADANMDAGDYWNATMLYEAALCEQQSDGSTLCRQAITMSQLAAACSSNGDHDRAATLLQVAIELTPGAVPERVRLNMLIQLATEVQHAHSDYMAAIAILQHVSEQPDAPDVSCQLASLVSLLIMQEADDQVGRAGTSAAAM